VVAPALAVPLLGLLGVAATAAGTKAPKAPDAAGPTTTLAAPPRLARVRVEITPGGASIQHDLIFPSGALAVAAAGEPTLFAAFTAQARPLAIEATRQALDAKGEIEATGTPLEIIDVAVKPKSAALLLGPAVQAGHVLRLPRQTAPFALRLRSAIGTHPVAAPTPMVSLMARLGLRGGPPIPLDRIEVVAGLGAKIRGARATLCGSGSDPRPLAIVFPGYAAGSSAQATNSGTIPPSSATRREQDDLCVDVLL
jgi:hypothetical protein